MRGEVRHFYFHVNLPLPLPPSIFIFQIFSSPVPKILLLSGHHGKQNPAGPSAHPSFPAAHQLLLPASIQRAARRALRPPLQPLRLQCPARRAPAPVDSGLPGHASAPLLLLQSAQRLQPGGRAVPAADLPALPTRHPAQARGCQHDPQGQTPL